MLLYRRECIALFGVLAFQRLGCPLGGKLVFCENVIFLQKSIFYVKLLAVGGQSPIGYSPTSTTPHEILFKILYFHEVRI